MLSSRRHPGTIGQIMRYSSFVQRISGEGAAAWEIHYRALEMRRQGRDVIILTIGEPDFDTPPSIIDAAVRALRGGRTHYGPVTGDRELRSEIARQHQARTGQPVGPDHVVVLAGAQCALFGAAVCVLDQRDEVIVPEPAYVTYGAVVGASGACMMHVPLRPEREFALDVADIAAAITPKTRALLINSPNNPTGAMVPRETWLVVGELCREHDLWLLSDEVYGGIVFEGSHVSPAGLPGMAERTITISSLSKSHAMTGWRLGWAIAPAELAEHIGRLALCMLYGSPLFVQDAALHALRHPAAELAAMQASYRRRRDLVCDRLGQVGGIGCHRPAAGMFVMADVRGTGLPAQRFAAELLEAEAVSVLPGEAFGPSAAGPVRINLGNGDDELAEACTRIARFAERRSKG
ncbi:MAG: pyridoxal phosphate-dependent aminotransferase [Dongiaceae bacterium]